MRSVSTLRPLHDLCMSTEAIRVGQMPYCLQKQKSTIYEIKTYSCLYRPPKRGKEVLKDLIFKDLGLCDKFEAKRCLDQCYIPPVPDSGSEGYKVSNACDRDLLKMDSQLPKRSGTLALERLHSRI